MVFDASVFRSSLLTRYFNMPVKNHFFKSTILIFLFFICTSGSAQDIQISVRNESVQIHEDTTFTIDVSIFLKKSDDSIIYPVFYDNELEKVSDIKVYTKRRNRFRHLKDPLITEETIDLDYITSKKVIFIEIPGQTEAKITYSISCNELMYFADLRFFSYYNTDTIKYQIAVPETFRLSYNISHSDLLDHLVMDSVRSDSLYNWHVEVAPVKVEPDPLMFFGIYRNLNVPLMRTIVVPKAYKTREKEYLNDWFYSKSETTKGLDSIAKSKIDELTQGITDSMLILEAIYNYVKSNFKYVSIQIGLGAFIPSHANEVFINKQGDCKDLSNFLSEALIYKGIESYLALAATYNHISDCDFPSLGSANHVVCVAYIDGEPVVLDPTDPIHVPNMPVQSMQGRSVLIVNPDGGEYYTIEAFTPEQNLINYNIELRLDSAQMLLEGDFTANYYGISGNFLRRAFMDLSNDRIHSLGKQHFEFVFNNQPVSDIVIKKHTDYVLAQGKLSIKGKVFNDNNMHFLFLDFVPRLIESEYRPTLLDGTYIGSTLNKKVNLTIRKDTKFEPFKPIEHTFSNDGVALTLIISNPSDYIINYEYDFILNHIFMENENINSVNEILKAFKNISNEPIITKSNY